MQLYASGHAAIVPSFGFQGVRHGGGRTQFDQQNVSCLGVGAHQMVMSAISDELPFGNKYCNTISDLVVNCHKLRNVHYFVVLRFGVV